MLANFLYIFLVILILKFLINLSRYLQCKHFLEEYKHHIDKPGWEIAEKSLQIVKLFEGAGVEDSTVLFVEEIGYGNLQHARVSALANIGVRRQDIVTIIMRMFHKSIGVYQSRMLEVINPLYWIETIIFLPKQILNYVGVTPESVIIKIIQLIYWFLCVISGFLLTVYKSEVDQLVKDWFSKFIH